MESEGSKKVEIVAKDNKHQITEVLAGSLKGDFLPLHIIYEGKRSRSLPALLKSFISEEISQLQPPSLLPPHESTTDLNIQEKNIIRYIAGYIIRKLKDRYKNIITKNEGLRKKKEQFLLILSSMESNRQLDYSRSADLTETSEWTELNEKFAWSSMRSTMNVECTL